MRNHEDIQGHIWDDKQDWLFYQGSSQMKIYCVSVFNQDFDCLVAQKDRPIGSFSKIPDFPPIQDGLIIW